MKASASCCCQSRLRISAKPGVFPAEAWVLPVAKRGEQGFGVD